MASAHPIPPTPPSGGHLQRFIKRLGPVAKTSVISCSLWSAGDVLCQYIENRKVEGDRRTFDKRRQAAQASYGLCFIGPLSHIWYEWLDTSMLRAFPAGGARFIGAKVVADLAIFGPIHLGAFLIWTAMAAGEPIGRAANSLRREMLPALAADTVFWAPVQTFNFSLVPLSYQAAFVNLACVVDAAFLSYIGNNPGAISKLFDSLRGSNKTGTGSSHPPRY